MNTRTYFISCFIAASILILTLACTNTVYSTPSAVIRVNQVGYKPNSSKTAIILSKEALKSSKFELIDSVSGKVVYKNNFIITKWSYAKFPFSYKIDFSEVKEDGIYYLEIEDLISPSFRISENVYKSIVPNLISFYKVQRCGYTNPHLHEICHKADAAYLMDGQERIDTLLDLTGGWHDAGDYVKFLSTTAYTTYSLLLAYELGREVYNFDLDSNKVPDILEEAKVGLDWLLRCNYNDEQFITQVQDLRDHTVGWRLPENDTLEFDRPAILGIGKNSIGIYSATMSLASRIWRERFSAHKFADKCLTSAENFYSIHKFVPDIDSSTTGVYQDNTYYGKLALAAIELYETTKRNDLLEAAKSYADSAGPDYWWSYGEISDYAFFRLAKYDDKYSSFIETSLKHFQKRASKNLFDESIDFYWGSNNTILGVALKNILWKRLTGSAKYDTLASNHVGYILGRNPWGISFISQTGTNYSENFHHQISKILNIPLPGGFAAGPVKKDIIGQYNIKYNEPDKYKDFQTEEAYYRDNYIDYVTNEPTIIANATGIFVFGLF